jgi:hypothetical protein
MSKQIHPPTHQHLSLSKLPENSSPTHKQIQFFTSEFLLLPKAVGEMKNSKLTIAHDCRRQFRSIWVCHRL